MARTLIQPSFSAGELTPSLYGRVDLAKWHVGSATMRNFFVNYRGGASSRAGTKFVGASKQTGSLPPRLITFQFSLNQGLCLEFGNLYMRVIQNGSYVLETLKNITGITNAAQGVVTSAAHGFSNGNNVYIASVGGMTQINGLIYAVSDVTTNTFKLKDQYGNYINTSAYGVYTSGGTAGRVYTLVTPYAIADLPELKWTQSADVMSLTHPSYPPYDLTRLATNNWTIVATTFSAVLSPPTGLAAVASSLPITVLMTGNTHSSQTLDNLSTGTSAVAVGWAVSGSGIPAGAVIIGIPDSNHIIISVATTTSLTGTNITFAQPITQYQYVVTAIDASTGDESIASSIVSVNSVDIAQQFGSISLSWNAVAGASSYRIYRAPEAYNNVVPTGSLFGYIGTVLGNSFTDRNITPDFTQTPPLHLNPFSPAALISINMTNQGTGYTSAPTVSITTGTGSGFSGTAVVIGGKVQAVLILNAGTGYLSSDTVVFTGGGGASAAATLTVGPATGTYPSAVAYFQQRRVYANTLNNPDTYFMSQPGSFTNFDQSPIPIDSDAITGTPWAQQVNGIQALVPMPKGLVILTGLSAWQLAGANGLAVTPTNQDAQPQAYNGCHDHIQPIQISYDIIYVQAKGTIVRDLSYNFFVNIYTGTDLSVLSDHLFEGFQLLEWAYCEEPYKIIWAVRNDGVLLSLTFLKDQEISGWARHDTNGLFQSVAKITEAEVDALYTVVQRLVNGTWFYYIERFDNRLWLTLEDSWCLDAALSLTQPAPAATLTASRSSQPGKVSTTLTIVQGGTGYTAPTGFVLDPTGTGATVTFGLTLGAITTVTVTAQGSRYTAPQLVIQDATGAGCVVELQLDNNITFTASAAVFTSGNIGDVIRMGGGQATVTAVSGGGTIATANLTSPITVVVPDDPLNTPVPAEQPTASNPSMGWTITTPVQTVGGLGHLEGMTVKALCDGSVEENLLVTGGSVTLSRKYSSIVVGLPFTAQLQSLYTDIPGEQTVQGKRKNIYAVTVRVQGSRGLKVGSNQIDASTQENYVNVPWTNLKEIKERGNAVNAGVPIPLFTGDERINIPATWKKPGQIAVQQDNPLPANILAFLPEVVIGDSNG